MSLFVHDILTRHTPKGKRQRERAGAGAANDDSSSAWGSIAWSDAEEGAEEGVEEAGGGRSSAWSSPRALAAASKRRRPSGAAETDQPIVVKFNLDDEAAVERVVKVKFKAEGTTEANTGVA